jgi:hypothetical protein
MSASASDILAAKRAQQEPVLAAATADARAKMRDHVRNAVRDVVREVLPEVLAELRQAEGSGR